MAKTRPLIAIVDDEEAIRRALTRLMDSEGMSVETFKGGAEFLESLEIRRPDCVVLDLHMPRVSGFEVLSELSKRSASIPVVAITGRDSNETYERAMAGGARAYLRKPVDGEELLAALDVALAGGQ